MNERKRAPVARDFMASPVVTVERRKNLPDVDRVMQAENLSALVVVDEEGSPVGVVSRSDLVQRAAAASSRQSWSLSLPEEMQAEEIMTKELVTADVSTPLDQVARTMAKRRIHRVIITRDGRPEGVVATKDVMRAIVEAELDVRLGEVMSDALMYVRPEEEMSVVVGRLAAAHVQGLVVKKDDWPVGLVTGGEVLVAQHWPATTAVEDWMSPRLLTLPKDMFLHRAAAGALALDVRHVLVMDELGCCGLVTGIDFARAYAKAAS
ncbi:MAG TPA: CBS domain-containing protein [Polyangiaceae bacterium]|nr:CBS domain-containing protein [Polyangiaceae bacterium]